MEPHPPFTARSRNLVRFCRHLPEETLDAAFAANFAFRDAGSRFSFLKSVGSTPGPDECFGVAAIDSRQLFRKLLGMDVVYDGLTATQQAAITPYNSMNYYRSHVVEYFCHNGTEPMPPTEGECTMWFAATDVLCIRYRLVNKSRVDVPVRLSWHAEGEPGERFATAASEQGFVFENDHSVIGQTFTSRAELMAADQSIRFAANGSSMRSTPVDRIIPAGGNLDCQFAARFWFDNETPPDWPVGLWNDESLVRAIADTEAAYAFLPEPEPPLNRHGDLIVKAVGTLRALRYRDRDSESRPRMTIHAGKCGVAATWFWDTGVSLLGLGQMGEREAATGAIRILLGGIKSDGTPPLNYLRQRYRYSYQMPLLAWGIGHYLAQCPDRTLLADAYEPLARYVHHWLDRFTAPRFGLVIHPPGGACLDDALRWHTGSPLAPRENHPWHKQDWGDFRPDLFICPDINAFLYLELLTLAEMADALNKKPEANAWRKRATELAAAINQWLIEPTTGVYQDRHVESGIFNEMITMASFIPAYAGIAPGDVAERLCREYILSPKHFLTTFPFPVVDRAHPTFRSGGVLHTPPERPWSLVQQSYWRGRTWLHANGWLLSALWQNGFRTEADDLADRMLEAVGRNEAIHECYDSLTGYGNGHPEFMWSSAGVLVLAYRMYAAPPVPQLARCESQHPRL